MSAHHTSASDPLLVRFTFTGDKRDPLLFKFDNGIFSELGGAPQG